MFVLPFRVDFAVRGVPILSLLMMLICLAVYWQQRASMQRWERSAEFACMNVGEDLRPVFDSFDSGCNVVVQSIAYAADADAQIDQIADYWEQQHGANIRPQLRSFWDEAHRLGGALPLTSRLVYRPHSLNLWRMVTSSFAHADWAHLLGNLFFFFLFAPTIEAVLGRVRFTAFVFALMLGTASVYSLFSLRHMAAPTLGLSAVVYGIMALFAYILPDARVHSVIWFGLRLWIAPVSAWFLAAWYVGGDALRLAVLGNGAGINWLAHVSGAAIGVLLGATVFRVLRDWARSEAKPHLAPYI